jgi:hypothetical protein
MRLLLHGPQVKEAVCEQPDLHALDATWDEIPIAELYQQRRELGVGVAKFVQLVYIAAYLIGDRGLGDAIRLPHFVGDKQQSQDDGDDTYDLDARTNALVTD